MYMPLLIVEWRTWFVLLVALLQGALYLVLLPPWQHYDEPTHFEYAWLIANRGRWPAVGDYDPSMRREVAASMLEHQFFWNLPKPDLFSNPRGPGIGFPELEHPPLYYLVVSLPLRLVRHLDVTSQLYVARSVSLLLFIVTIAVIARAMGELVGIQHPLSWTVPIVAASIPPVTDVMTSVNNDVGAVCIFSLFLWAAVRLLRYGFTWKRALGVMGTAVLAVFIKSTVAVALLLAPVVGIIALGQHLRWRLGRSLACVAVLPLIALLTAFQGGDAAYWYRWSEAPSQALGTRTNVNGADAVTLEATSNDSLRYLLNPILDQDVMLVAGQVVTVAGWVWAKTPTVVDAPGLVVSNRNTTELIHSTHALTMTTTPTFMAWTTTISATAGKVYYAFSANQVGEHPPTQLFLRDPILTRGAFSAVDQPSFSDASASDGMWRGQPFTNLVRNAGAQRGWIHLRPWAEHMLVKVLHHSPAQIVDALFDVEYTWPYLGGTIGPALYSEFFSSFAWGHVRLQSPLWNFSAFLLSVLALLGCLKWSIGQKTSAKPSLSPALLVVGLAGILIWLLALAWPLPYHWAKVSLPSARYTFPALLPTVLVIVGGWWALWPRRLRGLAVGLLLFGVFALDGAAIATIWSFYHYLPVT